MIFAESSISLAVILTLMAGLLAPVIGGMVGGWMKVLEVKNLGQTALNTRRYEYFQHQMNQLIEWRHQGASGHDVATRLISLIVSIDDAEMQNIAERKDLSADLRAHLAIIRLGQLINEERKI